METILPKSNLSATGDASYARAEDEPKATLRSRPVEARFASASGKSRILAPGRNVWRIARATRAAVLVDADAYYRRLEQSLRMARRSIWIVGWDFNGRISLRPDKGPDAESLGSLLRSLVERNEHLEVRILIWALGAIYSQKRWTFTPEDDWANHPRITIRLDAQHPLRASHHQKLVCIDDKLAFAGGIDLTVKRWDTPEHLVSHPARIEPNGEPYPPVHDVQMAVEGEAARALGDLARQRWLVATGEEQSAVAVKSDCWPEDLAPDLVDVDVAIARTRARLSGRVARREAALLNADALASARRSIYIETQYFASSAFGRVLAERLKEKDGPEVVILVTQSSRGLLESIVMGGNRDRLIRRLKKADRYGRVRVMYPVVPNGEGGDCEILIHSKVVIIDDRFMRIGSSNLNNRSEGLDTECDLAVEARNAEEARVIVATRDRLLAEHLASTPEAVSATIEEEGSLVRAIDRLNTQARGLRRFHVGRGATRVLVGTGLLDPKRPYWPMQWLGDGCKRLAHRISSCFL